MKKASYVYLPIFTRHIFYGNDIGAIRKLVSKYYKDSELDLDELDDLGNTEGFVKPVFNPDDDEHIRIFIMYVKDGADLGTVTHESVHLMNQVLLYVGQELDDVNDEVQAYLAGYFTNTFMEEIRGVKSDDGKLEKLKK